MEPKILRLLLLTTVSFLRLAMEKLESRLPLFPRRFSVHEENITEKYQESQKSIKKKFNYFIH